MMDHSISGVKVGGYRVAKVADKCADDCSGPKCNRAECDHLCIHMYSCDKACYDYNNGHLCKHIHRVHSMLKSQGTCTTSTTSELTEPQSLDGGFLSDDEDELDPLEYAESTAPPQQGRHVYIPLL